MQDTSPNPMHTLPADQQASVLPEQRSASKKGMWVVIVIVLLIAVGVGGYWFGVESSKLEQDPKPPAVAVEPTAIPWTNNVACTEDARVCPDGSSVGRIPPACEFAACPNKTEVSWEKKESTFTINTMGETRNYQFSFQYPQTWTVTNSSSAHSQDDLGKGCLDFTVSSPNGAKVVIKTVCSSWSGKTTAAPASFVEVADRTGEGNDASTRKIIRALDAQTKQHQYMTYMKNLPDQPSREAEVMNEVLVTYVPDDNYFIPTNITVQGASETEIEMIDDLVKSIALSRRQTTYHNSAVGYTISYPSDWEAINLAAGSGEAPARADSSMIEIQSTGNTQGKVMLQPTQLLAKPAPTQNESREVINGVERLVYVATVDNMTSKTYYFPTKDGGYLEVLVRPISAENKAIFDAMIKSIVIEE